MWSIAGLAQVYRWFYLWFGCGASSLAVQRVLGHEDLKTVLIYVKLAECDLEQVASAQSPADTWRL